MISIGAYTGRLPTSIPAIPNIDLLGHAILIGGLAFFLDGALGYRRLFAGAAFPRLAPALIVIAAAIEEFAQRLSPRRESSLSDFAADVIGVCVLCWASRRIDEAIAARRAAAPA
jgi:VanZ family protein